MAGVLNELGKINVPGDILSLPGTKVFSWGPSVIVYQASANIYLHCPKGLVSEASLWSVGRDRSADNFKNLLAFLRNKCRAYNVPAGVLDSTMFASAALGFTKNVAFETSVLHGVVNPLLPTIAVHRDALAHKFKMVWTWQNASIVSVVLGVVGVGTGAAVAGLFGTAALIYAGATAAAAAAAAGGCLTARAQFYAPQHVQTASSAAFPEYYADRSSGPGTTRVLHLPPGGIVPGGNPINLPATDPIVPIEELMDPERHDPSATLQVVDPTENREKPDKGPLRPGGIVSTSSIPVVPSNSSHSSLSAIAERIIKRGPAGKGLVDDELFDLFQGWVLKNLDEMGLCKDSVKAIPFREWNENYPPAQQALHVKALQWLNLGDYNERLVDMRGCFTKIEGVMKSTEAGVEKLAPRGIQSGSALRNVAVGPWCKAFSKRLAQAWAVSNGGGLMYTSGSTAEEIGAAYKKATEALEGQLGILEGDFARFDSTIHRRLLILEALIYKHTGCSDREYAAFIAAIGTFGRDKWGNKYSVDGGRHSGDHNTSCGNSVLQGLAIIFCCAFFDASRTKSDVLPTYLEIVMKHKLSLPVLGDDNLLIGMSEFVDQVPLAALLLKLGLELEPKKHMGHDAKYKASFCSSRFWPVDGGKLVLGPGVGRGHVKSGWYVNAPVGVDIRTLVRSDAIGRLNDNSFIPFLGPMWKRMHALTHGLQTTRTSEMKRTHLHNAHASEKHEACPETYHMLEVVYGLTRVHEQEYEKLLAKVQSLPCIVDYEPLIKAAVIDGVRGDPHGVFTLDPLVEETPELDDLTYNETKSLLGDRSCCSPLCRRCKKRPCKCESRGPYQESMDSCVEMTSEVNHYAMTFG
jgi:hypothetical protein